jgi:hypothetical protein
MACAKTGGSRRVRFGGAMGITGAPYSNVKMGELSTRQDFDGSSKGLPVKYGGGFFKKSQPKTKRQPKTKCHSKMKRTRKHRKYGKKSRKSFFGF